MSGFLIDFANDFADLIITFDVERYGATTKNAEGRAVPGVVTNIKIRGTYPQPAKQNDLKKLPEGSTLSSSIVIHCVEPVHITSDGAASDVLLYQGSRYKAVQKNDRSQLAGNYRTLFIKIQAGE